ncbi:MAG: hypothetical protein ACR2K3_02895 [Nocardioides sp.]
MSRGLPVSARLAWWGTAWLRGQEVTDHVVDAVIGADATHAVTGLPGSGETLPLALALGTLRATGADGIGLCLPVEGDPVGCGGPAAFNAAALEAGQAVVVGGHGLVPHRVGAAVTWTAYDAWPRQLSDVGQADRDLRSALLASAEALASLDVARWRPEVADELSNLRHRPALDPPAGVPTRCTELAARAVQAHAIVTLALEDDGAAVSASAIGLRRKAINPLAGAARRALVAACSAEVWPPGP